ncbi:unnamed protein product [Cuscuta epithymum]|uniref:Ycf2 N-terminal domain-containing protein n=1 Tax=Cuscuta epithymum TaxID=186058 RepID=A0AAV0E5F1_9ASTE|nr:unnamed protein product [Cuscuta epithymum]
MPNLILKTFGTSSTEEEIVNLETTYCQPFSDINRNIYDSEENHFHEYPNFNLNMDLVDIPCSDKYFSFQNKKKSKKRRCVSEKTDGNNFS